MFRVHGEVTAGRSPGPTLSATPKRIAQTNVLSKRRTPSLRRSWGRVCQDDPGRATLDQCVSICEGDDDCEQSCAMSASEGIDLYERAVGCVYCVECEEMCAGRVVCQ